MIITHKGIDVFYKVVGQGSVVVFLHGFLENSNIWNPFIPTLSKNHQIITIDLLGHGKTGCLGYVHSMELMAEMVNAVLSHLKVNQFIFICHSMGGYVGLAYAEKYSDKLKGLCLVNSTSREDSKERKVNRDRAIQAVKTNHKSFVRISISNLFRPKNRIQFSEKIKQLKHEALDMSEEGIIAALEGMKIRPDRRHVLKNSSFQTLMIIGKKDPVLNYEELQKECENTGTKMVEFPDGHMGLIENESLFLQKIMHFIENI